MDKLNRIFELERKRIIYNQLVLYISAVGAALFLGSAAIFGPALHGLNSAAIGIIVGLSLGTYSGLILLLAERLPTIGQAELIEAKKELAISYGLDPASEPPHMDISLRPTKELSFSLVTKGKLRSYQLSCDGAVGIPLYEEASSYPENDALWSSIKTNGSL